ncbi:DUF6614 family protein [Hyphomonas sp.]|uniref:DUF6614 family protein n=1 Tax=Hyphomonas sp. TaxID=87 RepID=UPI00391B30D9
MNLYHCMVELKSSDRALQFASAVDAWLGHLKNEKIISDWRLLRRKFGLASGQHTDFLIEIEVESMSELEKAFSLLSKMEDEHTRRYEFMHNLIASIEVGLYRPYPDPEQRERIAFL